MAKTADPKGDGPNIVHKNAILAETIKKESKDRKLYTDFSINPYNPMYTVTGKPNSLLEAELEQEQEDELMRQVIGRSQKRPTEKYDTPQTSAQEVGWITKPLLYLDRSDRRLYQPRGQTDVTKPKEAEWRLKEQTQNLN